MKNTLLFFALIFLTTIGCDHKQKDNSTSTSSSKPNITDVEGSYKGENEDVLITLKLNMDQSAFLTEAKIGGEANAQFGDWSLTDHTVTVSVNDDTKKYTVNGDQLTFETGQKTVTLQKVK